MTEVIKNIKGFEDRYTISNLGIVRSKLTNIIMKPSITKFGYARINLRYKNSRKFKSFFIHRLVAQNFLENPNNYKEINHIDCNKLNNCIENLEWCDRSYNVKYSYSNGNKCQKGINNGNHKLNIQQINEIKQLILNNKTDKEISKLYNVCSQTINNIRNNKNWIIK